MCYNCDKKGHISHFCKKPKKPKSKDDSGKQEGNEKASSSGSESANAAEKVEEEEGAWVAEEESDWFSEVVEAMGDKGRKGAMVEDLGDTSREAFVVAETVESNGTVELYNSGCTNHISPYCKRFENFEQTFPQSFKAVNKQSSNTIGKGIWLLTYKMVIPPRNCDSWMYSTPQTLHICWYPLGSSTMRASQSLLAMADVF